MVFHRAACARRRAVTGRGSSALLVKTNVPSPGSSPGASAADTGAAADLSIADGCGGKSTYRPQDVNLRPRAGTSATAIRGRMDKFPRNPTRLGQHIAPHRTTSVLVIPDLPHYHFSTK